MRSLTLSFQFDLYEHLSPFLNNAELSDVKLVSSEGTEFFAHQCILYARCKKLSRGIFLCVNSLSVSVSVSLSLSPLVRISLISVRISSSSPLSSSLFQRFTLRRRKETPTRPLRCQQTLTLCFA